MEESYGLYHLVYVFFLYLYVLCLDVLWHEGSRVSDGP